MFVPNKSPTIGASRGWQSETAIMRRKGCPGLPFKIIFAISEPTISFVERAESMRLYNILIGSIRIFDVQ